jgi:hypothetical protein
MKLGLHVVTQGDQKGSGDFLKRCADAGTPIPVIFAVGKDVMPDVQKYTPTTKVIFRAQANIKNKELGDGPDGMYTGDPVLSARAWMAEMMPVWAKNKADWYAPLNEQDPATLKDFAWLNKFGQECMVVADRVGYKLAMYAFSGGNPKDVENPSVGEPFTREQAWNELISSLRYAKANGHILLLHEYGFDFGTLRASTPHLALRYRRAYEFLARFDANPPLVISEASAGVGFKGSVPPGQWVQDAAWYDQELCKDPWVIGCCLYQLGGDENLVSVLPALSDYIVTRKTPVEVYVNVTTGNINIRREPKIANNISGKLPKGLRVDTFGSVITGDYVWRKTQGDLWVAERTVDHKTILLKKVG